MPRSRCASSARTLAVLIPCLLVATGGELRAQTAAVGAPEWKPQVSERLVRLPASALDKQIDRDFGQSTLGKALVGQEESLRLKGQTLADIDAAIELADGPEVVALKHRFLLEKQAYIQTAGERVQLERQKLETKKRLLDKVLQGLKGGDATEPESKKQLLAQQAQARKRLEQTVAMADKMVLGSPLVGDSKYRREFDQKMAALDALKQRMAEHPMNKEPEIDGSAVSKEEYLRHMVAATEGELALVGIEEEMLGMMAKLVSLDALALAEEVKDPELIDSTVPETGRIETAVRFFIQ